MFPRDLFSLLLWTVTQPHDGRAIGLLLAKFCHPLPNPIISKGGRVGIELSLEELAFQQVSGNDESINRFIRFHMYPPSVDKAAERSAKVPGRLQRR